MGRRWVVGIMAIVGVLLILAANTIAQEGKKDKLLDEGDEVRFGSCVLRVLTTPGHTPGGICLLADSTLPAQLFCGDLVFRDGVGRVDFPGGSGAQLLESIRRKVLTLPDETVLWPGHGEPTTVGRERAHNPFLQSRSSAGF